MGTEAEVSLGLSGVSRASQHQGVVTGGSSDSELIKGDGLSASLDDSSSGSAGESEGSDGGLGELDESSIIGDGADNNDNLVGVVLDLEVLNDLAGGHGGSVHLGQEQALEHSLVELGVSSSWVSND